MRDHDDTLLKDLERAPPLAPPDTLWPRLREGQRKALRRRRVITGATASACALLLVALVPWPSLLSPEPGPTAAQVASVGDDAREQIATLDRALQAAYDRGASDTEIAPLWEVRNALANRVAPAPSPADAGGIDI